MEDFSVFWHKSLTNKRNSRTRWFNHNILPAFQRRAIRKQDKQVVRSKQASSIPPWHLHRLLSPCFCPVLSFYPDLLQEKWHGCLSQINPLFHKSLWFMVFHYLMITLTREMARAECPEVSFYSCAPLAKQLVWLILYLVLGNTRSVNRGFHLM